MSALAGAALALAALSLAGVGWLWRRQDQALDTRDRVIGKKEIWVKTQLESAQSRAEKRAEDAAARADELETQIAGLSDRLDALRDELVALREAAEPEPAPQPGGWLDPTPPPAAPPAPAESPLTRLRRLALELSEGFGQGVGEDAPEVARQQLDARGERGVSVEWFHAPHHKTLLLTHDGGERVLAALPGPAGELQLRFFEHVDGGPYRFCRALVRPCRIGEDEQVIERGRVR